MKTTITFFLITITLSKFFFQIEEPVHLMFQENLKNSKIIITDNGNKDFYMNGLHFSFNASKNKCKTLKVPEIANIEFLSPDAFEEIGEKERNRILENQKNEKTISVMFNNDIFKKIYIYEKINGTELNRYEVIWVEEID